MSSEQAAEQLLSDALERYERAVTVGPRAELVAARAALCVVLESSGGALPVEVRDQLWRDQKRLRELAQERVAALDPLVRLPSHRPPAQPLPAS